MKTVTLAVLSLVLFACNSNSDKTSTNKSTVPATKEQHQHEHSETIELNNGEKWKVEDHMLLHIRNMEKDVATFSKEESTDYNKLAEKLEGNIELLTSNCTMEGRAHDELHKWLVPYMDLVTNLSNAKNEQEGKKHFKAIKESFVTFNTYFQ